MYALIIDQAVRSAVTKLITERGEISQFVVEPHEGEYYDFWKDYLDDKLIEADQETLNTVLDELEEELDVYIERPVEVDELANRDLQVTIGYHVDDYSDEEDDDDDFDDLDEFDDEEDDNSFTAEYDDLDSKLIPEDE